MCKSATLHHLGESCVRNEDTLDEARRYNDPSQDARVEVSHLGLAGFGIELGDTLIVQPFVDGSGLVLCQADGSLFLMPASAPLSDRILGKIIAFLRGNRLFHVKHEGIQALSA
jgi:hypothetical protein